MPLEQRKHHGIDTPGTPLVFILVSLELAPPASEQIAELVKATRTVFSPGGTDIQNCFLVAHQLLERQATLIAQKLARNMGLALHKTSSPIYTIVDTINPRTGNLLLGCAPLARNDNEEGGIITFRSAEGSGINALHDAGLLVWCGERYHVNLTGQAEFQGSKLEAAPVIFSHNGDYQQEDDDGIEESVPFVPGVWTQLSSEGDFVGSSPLKLLFLC
jgi:hypothetical protein